MMPEAFDTPKTTSVEEHLLFALKNLLAVSKGEGGTAYPADDIAREAINRAQGRPWKHVEPLYAQSPSPTLDEEVHLIIPGTRR